MTQATRQLRDTSDAAPMLRACLKVMGWNPEHGNTSSTFVRVYSGVLKGRHPCVQLVQGHEGTRQPVCSSCRGNSREEGLSSKTATSVRAIGLKSTSRGEDALR